MPKALEFDGFCLVNCPDQLKVSVTSIVHLNAPACLSLPQLDSNDKDIFNTLASGNVWVARGLPCSFDFFLSFDNMLLAKGSQCQLVESFGSRIRDAQLWSQLSLSPSLVIPKSNGLCRLKPEFSISFGPEKAPLRSASQPRSWLSKTINVRPPDNLPCVELSRLQICLSFDTILEKHKPVAKRVKRIPAMNDQVDAMLLNQTPFVFGSPHPHPHIFSEGFACDLSERIPRCLESSEPDKTLCESILTGQPMPSAVLSRYSCSERDDDMLLSTSQDSSLGIAGEPLETDMLLSQQCSSTPSLASQLTLSSESLPWPPPSPLKRAASEFQIVHKVETHSGLGISSALKLTEAAIELLIAGRDSNSLRIKDITTNRSLPENSLSKLAPAIFSPGFKDSMANNAQFLSTISQAISSTWLRQAQSPSLRKKLTGLVDSSTSTPKQLDLSFTDEASKRLAAIVQTRLWSMMQRKLYDPSAWKNLSSNPPYSTDKAASTRTWGQEAFEDPLGQAKDDGRPMVENPEELIKEEIGDGGSDFEDLLDDLDNDDDYDDLLQYYFEGTERGTEPAMKETDETLFNCTCSTREDEDDFVLLLVHGRADESMLL